jgi:hypothetical protein
MDPQVTGKPLSFVVAVAPAASSYTYPSGSVSVSVDGVNQGTFSLTKGAAMFSLPAMAVGDHNVIASYAGDGTYGSSVSNTLKQSITSTFEKPLQYGIDVTTKGLKGDGVTDNTAALRALIASFPGSQIWQGARPGGERLYFPAGTYMFSDSIDLSSLDMITFVGDVDVDGNPASILKANSISTPKSSNSVLFPNNQVNYYPLIFKDSNTPCCSGAQGLHMSNIEVDGPLTPQGVAVFIQGAAPAMFENDVFRGFIGIWGGENMFTAAVRDSKFIGNNAQGSMALSNTGFLIDNSDFRNWYAAALVGACGGPSIIRSTFEHNHWGIVDGSNWLVGSAVQFTKYAGGCASFNDLTFTDNDIAIYQQQSYTNQYTNINITGSNNAPGGMSQDGFRIDHGVIDAYDAVNVSGVFSEAAVRTGDQDAGLESASFFASTFSNSNPGATTFSFNLWGGPNRNMCPQNSSCAYSNATRFNNYTYACAAGTMTVQKAWYDGTGALSGRTDCTSYVASQCNGKTSCVVNYQPYASVCNNPNPESSYIQTGSAIVTCGSGAQNPPLPGNAFTFDQNPEPNVITDVDNVTARHFVAGRQPTVVNSSMFIDVSKRGILPWTSADQGAAIQAIINGASDGAVFYFPQGIYRSAQTLDFSRLKNFTLAGDGAVEPTDSQGTTIYAGSGSPAIKVDYGTGAGTFHIKDVGIPGGYNPGELGIYARNSVLSDIHDLQLDGQLDNPFMTSLTSSFVFLRGISFNGGMHSTLENADQGGGDFGIRAWGTDHSVYGSRFEVQDNGGIEIGADPQGNEKPTYGFSVADIEEEAPDIGVKITNCTGCFIAAVGPYGHSRAGHGPNGGDAPDYEGIYFGNAHNVTVSASNVNGYWWNSDFLVSGQASNDYIIASSGRNDWTGCPPGCLSESATTWYIDPAAQNISLIQTNRPSDTTPPSVPTGLTATPVNGNQINLSWSPSTDNVAVTGYKIYRNGTLVTTVTGTSYFDGFLNPGTTYTYTVRAYDALPNVSASTAQVSATTPAGNPPMTVTVAFDGLTRDIVQWNKPGTPPDGRLDAEFQVTFGATKTIKGVTMQSVPVPDLNRDTYTSNINPQLPFVGVTASPTGPLLNPVGSDNLNFTASQFYLYTGPGGQMWPNQQLRLIIAFTDGTFDYVPFTLPSNYPGGTF